MKKEDNNKKKNEFEFEIKKNIGVLSEGTWNMELNWVKFGDNEPKYDIRKWNADHTKMGKGISLSKEELKTLWKVLDKKFNK